MPPLPVEVADSVSVYVASLDKWYTGWWNIFHQKGTSKYKAINISGAGENTIISGVTGKRLILYALFFTVGGEVDITLKDGSTNISGPMSFGASAEPRGMVVSQMHSPIELGEGNSFIINISVGVQVSGTVLYQER